MSRWPTRWRRTGVALGLCLVALPHCGGGEELEPTQTIDARRLSGGETTVVDRTSAAFTFPSANLSPTDLERHLEGDVAFEAAFVTAPSEINPGLGPLFNNTACAGCHIGNGRGMPVVGDSRLNSQMLVRVSLEQGEAAAPGGPAAVPGMGTQIQDHAIRNVVPEASVRIDWLELDGEFEDGEQYTLRTPALDIMLPDGFPLAAEVMTSLRQPPPVHGLGLLEAVPEEDIVAIADPEDADGDGISGRPNRVWSGVTQSVRLGRFGHKANSPTLLEQAAGAYAEDMGVSNPLIPDAGGSADIAMSTLEAATFYTQTLAVPARARMDDRRIERGEGLFRAAGCHRCHVETLVTGPHEIEALSDQVIHPFTDMLLHDMGPELADGRPDFEADGREWRTAPLWGLGLTHTVAPNSGFLHDGRARTIQEAILWHGGEAEGSREAYSSMSPEDREALLAFLQSL